MNDSKPLKRYRSHAERTRVLQGWIMIVLAASNITLTLTVIVHGR